MRGNSAGNNNSGMTLLEVVLGLGIFSIIMVAFLQILMSVHRTNNAVMASMTANAAIRSLADEALATAVDSARDGGGNYASAFIDHYRSILNDSGENFALPIGPDGEDVPRVALERIGGLPALLYRFPVPEPGSFSRYTTTAWSGGAAVGDLVPYKFGLGEMRIYVNEASMPVDESVGGTLSGQPALVNNAGVQIAWETNGDRPKNVTDGSTDGLLGDGAARVGESVLTSDAPLPGGIDRVFADITVTYYDDPAHRRVLAVNERRILVTGSFNESSRVWPASAAL